MWIDGTFIEFFATSRNGPYEGHFDYEGQVDGESTFIFNPE